MRSLSQSRRIISPYWQCICVPFLSRVDALRVVQKMFRFQRCSVISLRVPLARYQLWPTGRPAGRTNGQPASQPASQPADPQTHRSADQRASKKVFNNERISAWTTSRSGDDDGGRGGIKIQSRKRRGVDPAAEAEDELAQQLAASCCGSPSMYFQEEEEVYP